jgi:NAD:arginine ADP-ribosyltransferase
VAQAKRSVRTMKAKFPGGAIPHDLTLDQAAALHLYTVEGPFYHRLNALLRNPDRARIVPLFDFLALLRSACLKLPKHAVTTYRGVKCARTELKPAGSFEKDGMLDLWAVTSTARKIDRIQTFLGTSGDRTILALECRHAVDIRPFSAFGSGEEEFILVPGSSFEVSSVLDAGNGLSIVQMAEDPDLDFGAGMS